MPAKDIMTLPLGETHEELGPIYRALRSVSHPRYLLLLCHKPEFGPIESRT